MSELGGSRSAELYSEPLAPGEVRITEVPEAEPDLDARIAEALEQIQQTNRELAEALAPAAQESPAGVIAALAALCDRVSDALGDFLKALFGDAEPTLDPREARVALLTERLNLKLEDVAELQAIRRECADLGRELRPLAEGAEEPAPFQEVDELRQALTPFQEAIHRFAERLLREEGAEAEPVEQVTVIGDPEGDARFWHPQGENERGELMTCGIVTQEMILDKVAGTPDAASENVLLEEAVRSGWYDTGTPESNTDGGTPVLCLGFLLRAHGVSVEAVPSSTLDELVTRLSQGQAAIAGVNMALLHGTPDLAGQGTADHVVWVTGVEVAEDASGERRVHSVFVNDSGDPENGRGREVPVAQFLKAWEASGNHTVYARPASGQEGGPR